MILKNNYFIFFKSLKKFLILIFILAVFLFFSYLIFIFDGYKIIVKNNKLITQKEIEDFVNLNFKDKRYFFISTNKMENDIKTHFEYVNNVTVEKSLIWGYVIHIDELLPKAYIYLINSNQTILVAKDQKIVQVNKIYMDVPLFNYINEMNENIFSNDNNIIYFVDKILYVYNFLKDKNDELLNNAVYFFDRFGNLFLEINKIIVIKFDLNERFYTIKKQLNLALNKYKSINLNEELEIDIRFKYLIVRKKQ